MVASPAHVDRRSAPAEANIPAVSVEADPERERSRRKWEVAVGYRILCRFGLDEGISGHITARDPIVEGAFWTAPFGSYFGAVMPDDLILVDHGGDIIDGSGILNRAAFAIHSRLHAARPDVNGACHAHGLHGKAFSSLKRPLLPITQDACAFYEDHGVHLDYGGVVFDTSEGDAIADTLGHRKAVLLANHGHLTVGSTVGSSVWWYVTMERSCQAQLLAEAAGEPDALGHDAALAAWRSVGPEDVGNFAFSVLAKRITIEYPELASAGVVAERSSTVAR